MKHINVMSSTLQKRQGHKHEERLRVFYRLEETKRNNQRQCEILEWKKERKTVVKFK